MKTLLSTLFLLTLTFSSINAQTTAQDWTKTDCDGNTHTLFNYLNGGKIVMIQFDMMDCIYCTTAAKYTDKIYQNFQKQHPDKLIMFSMGYTNYTYCADMQDWKKTYNFTFATIEKCPNEVAYYGGMGMPTLVVLGGGSHNVFYKKLGFTPSDTTKIIEALNSALIASEIEESPSNSNTVNISPNPVINQLNITLEKPVACDIYITDVLGRKILTSVFGENERNKSLDLSALKNGLYFLSFVDNNRVISNYRFIKQ